MKHILSIALCAIALLLASCTSYTIEPTSTSSTVRFSVTAPNNFHIDSDDLSTRATLSEASLAFMYVIVDGELALSQQSTDDDFGAPAIELDHGTHTINIIASSNELVFQDGLFAQADGNVRHIYAATKQLEVTPKTPDQSIELSRIIAGLKFTADDALPTNIGKVRITLNNRVLEASQTTFTGNECISDYAEWDISAYAGIQGINSTIYSLCPSLTDSWDNDVTVTFYDNKGATIITHTINEVPLKANTRVNIHGDAFAKNPTLTVTVNTDWAEEPEIEL